MRIILFLIGLACLFIMGWCAGSSFTSTRWKKIREEDMKRYRKLQDEAYERGYKDGFAQKSNAIRREIELDAAKTGKPLYSLVWPNGKGE